MAESELTADHQYAVSCVGPFAKPTGRMRMLADSGMGRLQCEWRGDLGYVWVDVPTVEVAVLPPRQFEDVAFSKIDEK